METWIMAGPDDMRCWVGWSQRTLHPFEIAQQFFQVGDIIMDALVVVLPTMCCCLCLESQDKCIDILLRKGLQRLSEGMLLDEKGEKVPQTIGASMQRTCAHTCRQLALDVLFDDGAKYVWYVLKINVVTSGMWCIAKPLDQAGIPFIFCKLLCALFQGSKCRCSLNEPDIRVFHCDFTPSAEETRQTCPCVCSQAARNASS